jgi:hypothetical protein
MQVGKNARMQKMPKMQKMQKCKLQSARTARALLHFCVVAVCIHYSPVAEPQDWGRMEFDRKARMAGG